MTKRPVTLLQVPHLLQNQRPLPQAPTNAIMMTGQGGNSRQVAKSLATNPTIPAWLMQMIKRPHTSNVQAHVVQGLALNVVSARMPYGGYPKT